MEAEKQFVKLCIFVIIAVCCLILRCSVKKKAKRNVSSELYLRSFSLNTLKISVSSLMRNTAIKHYFRLLDLSMRGNGYLSLDHL